MKKVIWAFPLVFLIHDTEELITVESWSSQNRGVLAERLGGFFSERALNALSWTTLGFAIAMSIIFAVICLASYRAARRGSSANDRKLFLAGITILFVNVFTHAGQAILFGGYTPGVWTAVTVALPYTLYVYYRIYRDGWLRTGKGWGSGAKV